MKTIWKFPIEIQDTVDVPMPHGAIPIHVAEQWGSTCIWALVESENVKVNHRFFVRGTGHPMGDADKHGQFVGTVLLSGGLVFHFFDNGERNLP